MSLPDARIRELTSFVFSWRTMLKDVDGDDDVVVETPTLKRMRDEEESNPPPPSKKRKRVEEEKESTRNQDVIIEEAEDEEPPLKKRRVDTPWLPREHKTPRLAWYSDRDAWPEWSRRAHVVRLTYTGPTFGNRDIEFWSHANFRNVIERCKYIEFFGGFDDPSVHYYVIDALWGGYTSVTTFLHQFFADFELVKYQVAAACSRTKDQTSLYFGKTTEQVLGFWDTNRDNGTCRHAAIDDHLQGRPLRTVYQCGASDPLDGPPPGYYHFMADHPHLVPYFTEFSVFDRDWCICGQFDALFWDTRRLCFILVDWKNVLNFKESSYQKGIHPLTAHMDDCHRAIYTLQLNIYRTILEKHYGFVVKEMWIVNFPPREQAQGAYMKIVAERMDMTPFFAECPFTEEGKARRLLWGGEKEFANKIQ